MARKSWTPARRLRLFEAHEGICHICHEKIDGTREAWDVEHIIPIAMGGEDDESNAAPAHVRCHTGKTSKDRKQIAKANRVRAKHQGAYRSRSTIPGSKSSKFKRKIDGSVVLRD